MEYSCYKKKNEKKFSADARSTVAGPAPAYDKASLSYAEASLSYAEAPLSYAEGSLSYAEAPLSYVKAPLSYAEAPLSYAEAPLSYAEAPLSYAEGASSYADFASATAEPAPPAVFLENLPVFPSSGALPASGSLPAGDFENIFFECEGGGLGGNSILGTDREKQIPERVGKKLRYQNKNESQKG